jgi:hypothetical protein
MRYQTRMSALIVDTLKHRKFPTIDDALAYLKSHGTLTYYGRLDAITNYYTYVHKGRFYPLYVYDNGLVEWREDLM